jgi:outer membrane protein, multidrug efflux system
MTIHQNARPVGETCPSKLRRSLAVTLLTAALGACTAVGPDYVPPHVIMPDQWHQDLVDGLTNKPADLVRWWTGLDDPILDDLMVRANNGNLTAKEAVARILEARSNVGIASGEELPAINGLGNLDYNRISTGVQEEVSGARERTSTLYELGMDATWEVDLWGRISRSVESADASYQATLEDFRDVLVSLYAEVALAYTDARTFQARIDAALRNINTQRQTLNLVNDRLRAELASDLEVAQAQLNLATTEASVPPLRTGLSQSIHRLSVLIGERPAALYPLMSAERPIPQPPKRILVGVPADTLRRRPDIRSAERQLAAQTAQVGVATADLYPRLTLSGFFAFQKFGPREFFDSQNLAYGLGPQVIWNVFDGGRVRSNIDVQDARTEQALFRYEQTVLNALREVEDASVGFAEENRRQAALARSVNAASRSVKLVQDLYVTGLTDFQNVQDQEQRKAQQDDQYAESTGRVTLNLINLYRALGGGWQPVEPDTKTTTDKGAPRPDVAMARPRSSGT